MKKLLLLTLIGGLALSVSAQYNNDNRGYDQRRNDRVTRQDDRFGRRDGNQLDRQIMLINQEYDYRINSIRRDPSLRNGRKRRTIRQLERERNNAVNRARDNYSGRYDNGYGGRRRSDNYPQRNNDRW